MANEGDWGTQAPTLIAALGLGGVIGKVVDWLLGRGTSLQKLVDARIALILDADKKRMEQMSDALDDQARRMEDQSRRIEEQSGKIDDLQASIATLVGHISSLEDLLRAAQIKIPPRPSIKKA